MVVHDSYNHITLESILQDAVPLSPEDSGCVIGQVFDGLKYLHEQGLAYGNLDPRSILISAKDILSVKLIDIAISELVSLGKPEGYHEYYASSKGKFDSDQSPRDIWSAGAVGLRLLHGRLPPCTQSTLSASWRYPNHLEAYLQQPSPTQPPDDGLRFFTKVLRGETQDRPSANELLEDPWIQETRRYKALQLPEDRLVTPQGSRHTSVGPSKKGPSSNVSTNSSTHPALRALMQSHPYAGDEWHDFDSQNDPGDELNDFDSQPDTIRSPRSNHSDTNSAVRLAGTPTEQESDDSASASGSQGSLFSQSHQSQSSGVTANLLTWVPRAPTLYESDNDNESGGEIALGTQSSVSENGSRVSVTTSGTTGRDSRQREAQVEKDSGEESETEGHREPLRKKPRR